MGILLNRQKKGANLATPSTQEYISEPKRVLSEQIERVQRQQQELMRQTNQDLENLKSQLESNIFSEGEIEQAKQPLIQEINILRQAVKELQEERAYARYQIESMKSIMISQAKSMEIQIHNFSAGANQSLEEMLLRLDNATVNQPHQAASKANSLPQVLDWHIPGLQEPLKTAQAPVQPEPEFEITPTPVSFIENVSPEVIAAPKKKKTGIIKKLIKMSLLSLKNKKENKAKQAEEKALLKAEKAASKQKIALEATPSIAQAAQFEAKPTEPKKKKSKKKLIFRALRTSFAIYLVWFGFSSYSRYTSANVNAALTDAGQVAGVSTEAPSASPSANSGSSSSTDTNQIDASGADSQYKESQADVPFNLTIWEKSVDPDFGINIEYPKNATNRVRIIGGSNLWFLRKNSYLLKISRIETVATLDEWWNNFRDDYSDGYTYSKGSFKNFPAMVGQPTVNDQKAGTQYFVKKGAAIYQLWIKNDDPTTDDGQRIAYMINSLTFTTN